TREDLYQVLAYCRALGIPRGALVQVGAEPGSTVTVRDGSTRIEVLPIRLDGQEPARVEAAMAALAERLADLLLEDVRPSRVLTRSARWPALARALPPGDSRERALRL